MQPIRLPLICLSQVEDMSEQQVNAVAILSPGDMGHAIGRELRSHGLDVITCLRGRSDRTRHLSKQAGLREVDNLRQVVSQADLVLSILVPAQAESAADDVAAAMRDCDHATHFVDCNAISPQTVRRIGATICAAGGQFSDASIIGHPPGTAAKPRLYVSGPDAAALLTLDGCGVAVKQSGTDIGQASGLKMCYAAMTKGTFALYYALAVAADRLDLLDALLAEFEFSQPDALQRMRQFLPKLPAKAWRWVGEMEQIAATLESVNVTPDFHKAAADIYQLISKTSLGQETPETIDHNRSLETTIAEIVKQSETK